MIGKTSLLVAYTENKFDEGYNRTIFDNYTTMVKVDGKMVNLNLWDTAGQEIYDRLRPLSYPNTNVFIMAFCLVKPESYKHLIDKWYPEIKHHCPNAKLILVGTKSDLKSDAKFLAEMRAAKLAPITHDQGVSLKNKINAEAYIECSSRTQEGIGKVFEETIKAGLKKIDPPICRIL